MKRLFLELRNLIFKRKETFEYATTMFHEDYDEVLDSWREKGFKDAVDQWDFESTLKEMSLEDVADEHMKCAEEVEWLNEFVNRAIRRKIRVGLWSVFTDDIALIALALTIILVFGFGAHPLIITISIAFLAIGDLPYFFVSWFYDGRLLDAYYHLGWDQFETAQLQAFWQTMIYTLDEMVDLTDVADLDSTS